MSNNRTSGQFVPIALTIIISIAAGYFGGIYLSRNHPHYGENKIDAILEIIDKQYVDTVNVGQLIETTAKNLVSELDPHSVLISAEELEQTTDNLEGSFSGIGVSFNTPYDTILIISIISGGPAEKAGILPFDRIITINDSVYAGKEINQNLIIHTLRGAKNSKVKLGIQRGNSTELIYFDVTRGDVPNYSIDVSYTINQDIGYIKVKNFSRTTYNEFITALAKFKQDGCNSYIVDLRGNVGGYLDAAIRVTNEFVPANRPIVYTEGKAYQRQNFFSDGTGSCQNAPIVVLVDEFSGSASEIFAGAIQDNDRGVLIGRRTYGKGLVQAAIMLDDGSELRLTIARYYTPSGRCIQKAYELGKTDEYDMDLYNRYMHGEFDSADSIKMIDSLAYTTLGGRTVYGGGGIMPDIFIPRDTHDITSYYSSVINSGVLYQFALDYSDRNHNTLASFKTWEALYAYLQQEPLIYEFTDFAEANGIKKRPTLIQISRHLIENLLHAYIVRNFFDAAGFYPVFQKDDITIQRAIQVIRNGTWMPDAS
jgi:carboxyl-terminal processing protease